MRVIIEELTQQDGTAVVSNSCRLLFYGQHSVALAPLMLRASRLFLFFVYWLVTPRNHTPRRHRKHGSISTSLHHLDSPRGERFGCRWPGVGEAKLSALFNNVKNTMRGISAVAVLLLAIAGCTTSSINPLFTEKDLVEENVGLGNWRVDDDWRSKLTVESLGKKTYRIIAHGEDGAKDAANLWVFKLGNHYFIDMERNGNESRKGGHEFARIAIIGDKLYLRTFNDYWLTEQCRKFPREIPHRFDGERLILAAETADLQSFVLKFVDDPVAFGKTSGPLTKVGGIPIQASGLASKKYRTFNYWYEVRMAIHSVSISKNDAPEKVAATLENLSKSISDLPTFGVDLEAVECATTAIRMLNSSAAFVREYNDTTKIFFKGFFYGLTGDPLGGVREVTEQLQQIQQQVSSCQARFDRARVTLTDRYEIEFPAIKF